MKFNKARDFMKYIAKYSLKNIAVFIAILLFVLIVFLFLTKKVIENADNKDTKLSTEATQLISVGTDKGKYIISGIKEYLIQHSKSSKENTK